MRASIKSKSSNKELNRTMITWQNNISTGACVKSLRGGRVCPVIGTVERVSVGAGVLSTTLTGAVYQAANMMKDFAHEPGGSDG